MRKNVSLKDVAAACDISVMTASRAFREAAAISPETRELVLKTAEKLGYSHSGRSGRPATGKAGPLRQIQLILGNSANRMYYFHMRLLTALEQSLAQAGFECVIRTCGSDYPIFVRLLDRVRNDRSAETIILGSFIPEQLEKLVDSLPGALLIDNAVPPSLQHHVSTFSFDNRGAAAVATDHLVDSGRRKILVICGQQEHFFSRELLAGYRDSLERRQLPFEEKYVRYTDFSAAAAADAVLEARRDGADFDAVFTNDEMATGVYRALHELGLRIPEDVAVCGCDDLPIGAQLYPSLTTISLDYRDLAALVVRHLEAERLSSCPEVRLPGKLRIRQSTAPISECGKRK